MYASKAIIYIFINVGDLQLSDTNLQIVLKLNNTLPNVLLGDFWSQNPAPPHNCKSHLLMLLQEETAAEWGHLPHVSHTYMYMDNVVGNFLRLARRRHNHKNLNCAYV